MIPFLDVSANTAEIRDELDEAYRRFMDSGNYILGKEVSDFEQAYAEYCAAKYCVGVASGLDALILALRAVGVGPGDDVIVPSNTYIATWLAVTHVGANLVPVEPDPATLNLDPSRIEPAVTQRTRVIMPVNLYGQPADYDPILEIARSNQALVIVDNAQAHGAKYKNRRVGGLADLECHSFYPSKNLGAFGDAGAVTTNNDSYADRIAVLRNYGSREKYYNEVIGTNSRLDSLQAAFLRVKLRHLDRWNARRQEIAKTYLTRLQGISELVLPGVPEWAEPVWHLFVVRTSHRTGLREYLSRNEIATLIHYPLTPHESQAYRELNPSYADASFPIASEIARSALSLPIGPQLDDASVAKVVDAIRDYFKTPTK